VKLHLDEPDIKEAVEVYVRSRFKIETTDPLVIEFSSGRSPPSVYADIDLDAQVEETETTLGDVIGEEAADKEEKVFNEGDTNASGPFDLGD
jgi:hypothetical protein